MTDRTAPATKRRGRRADGPAPDRAALRATALAHLARFGTTRAGLEQVLARMVQRWARGAAEAGHPSDEIESQAATARALVADVVRDMADLGAVDDAAFAGSRARSLTRVGRSRRAVQAHLAARGVGEDVADAVLDDALGTRDGAGYETELAAALVFARKRRVGPFGPAGDHDDDGAFARRLRALEAMARAGFGRAVAEAALDMDPDEAEERIFRMKSI
ncbi:regulatory protein RecX [Gluconacetobacter tumulisoli]|nr:RecX family transcriptional regulator [Gluconacetobacter tumulisoli]